MYEILETNLDILFFMCRFNFNISFCSFCREEFQERALTIIREVILPAFKDFTDYIKTVRYAIIEKHLSNLYFEGMAIE